MRWLADENLNNNIARALRRRDPGFDLVRVQDVGLAGVDDPSVLEWAAANNRVLLTHDVTTITDHAYRRLVNGLPMPGVFEIAFESPIGVLLEDLLLIDRCSRDREWEGQIVYLPLNRG